MYDMAARARVGAFVMKPPLNELALTMKPTKHQNGKHGATCDNDVLTPTEKIGRTMVVAASRYIWHGMKTSEIFLAYLLATIGRRPGPKHQLDRINNDGNYEPGNIKWKAPQKEQMITRRRIGPFWDIEVRRAAGEKGRRTRWG